METKTLTLDEVEQEIAMLTAIANAIRGMNGIELVDQDDEMTDEEELEEFITFMKQGFITFCILASLLVLVRIVFGYEWIGVFFR